jgi:hypothetical protein
MTLSVIAARGPSYVAAHGLALSPKAAGAEESVRVCYPAWVQCGMPVPPVALEAASLLYNLDDLCHGQVVYGVRLRLGSPS